MAKRGRPEKFIQEWYDWVRNVSWSNARTKRGMQDAIFSCKAMRAIIHEEFENKAFLYSDEKNYTRTSLLAELGRLEDKDVILHVAKYLCEWAAQETLTIKRAIRWVRMIRLDRISEAASENGTEDAV